MDIDYEAAAAQFRPRPQFDPMQVRYPEGALVLKPCVLFRPRPLCWNNPGTRFVCADISEASVRVAMGQNPGLPFLAGDLYALPFPNATFDHVFACYVLEHLERPGRALENLLRVLKPGGTLTSVEGDHGSCFFYPETPEALAAWACLPELQALLGGDSLIEAGCIRCWRCGFFRRLGRTDRIYCDPSLPA